MKKLFRTCVGGGGGGGGVPVTGKDEAELSVFQIF